MKIVICIVLYKKKIEDLYINDIIQKYHFDARVCIFDNSPEYNNSSNQTLVHIEYYPQEKNQGIAIPYNISLNIANDWGANYLLLLDQDTCIEKSFFNSLEQLFKYNYDIILPKIFHENTHISPLEHNLFSKKPINNDNLKNIQKRYRVLFINSGTILSINFLNKIGGFNSIFWLDMQDYWLSLMAYKNRATIKILDYSISHNLSVMNKEYISIERYLNQHLYTFIFNFRYENSLRKVTYIFFLILRYFKRFNYLKKNNALIKYWRIIFQKKNYDKYLYGHL